MVKMTPIHKKYNSKYETKESSISGKLYVHTFSWDE
jgi:hypothetical protein